MRHLFFIILITCFSSTASLLFAQCAGTQTYTVDPQPGAGNTYAAGQIVEFCYTMTDYNQLNSNWFHGLTFTFGPGWNTNTFTVISYPQPATPSTGSSPDSPNVWGYFPNGTTSSATGTAYGPGFYFETGSGNANNVYDGIPGDNYGDDCTSGTCTWVFCFSIQVSPTAPTGTSVSLTATSSADGQSGSFTAGIGSCGDPGTSLSTATVGGVLVPIANATGTNISCLGTCDGSANVTAESGTPPYKYLWSNSLTTQTINNLCAAAYTCTVTDANNSTATASYTVLPTAPFATTDTTTPVSCASNSDGTMTVDVQTGNPPYSFVWSNGTTGNSDSVMSNLGPGPISVSVTDANGCSVLYSANIVQPQPILIQLTSFTNVSCFGGSNGSLTVTPTGGTPGYIYFWGDGTSVPSDTGLTAGTYFLEVDDTNFCFEDTSFTITQPQAALALNTPSIQNTGCNGGTGSITAFAIQGTPAYTFSWVEQPGGQTYTGQGLTGLSAGNYALTVTDAQGCTDTTTYTVLFTQPLIVTDSVVNVSCYGGNNGQVKVNIIAGTPPYTFSYDQSPPETDSVIGNLSQGPIDIYVTDSNNCITDTLIEITQPTPLTVPMVTTKNVSCTGGSDGAITVTGSGGTPGYTYSWNDGTTNATDNNLAIGTFTVTATDINQCTASASYSVSQPTQLVINPAVIQNIGCSGGNTGSITGNAAQGTPAYTYAWTELSNGQSYTGQTISNLAVDNYSLTVTDANGCTADTSSYAITSIPLLSFTASSTPVSCYNGNNGSALASVTSGTPPYMYSFNNGTYGTDSAVGNVSAGNLLINVTDANNCSADTTITLSQPTQLVTSLVNPQTNEVCNGGGTGELDVTTTGGTPGYTFKWSNQFIGTDNTALTAGTYTLIVIDFNDCADTTNYIITQPTPVVANPIVTNALCYETPTGSIDANPSGGTPGYSFIWNTGETTQVADTLVKGLYDCTITDANGCSIITTATVSQPTHIVLTQDSGIAVLCVGQSTGKLLVTATGGYPPYFYNATQDGVNFVSTTDGIITGLDTGIYNIQIFDSVGCSVIYQGFVPNAVPDVFYNPVADSTLCYGPNYDDGGVFVLDSTAQNGPYKYSIDGGALQDTGYFGNLSAGPHVVTAVSNNGCTTSIPVVVPQPLPVEVVVTPDSVTLPLGGSQSVLVTTLNTTNPTYNWVPSSGLSCVDCPNPVVNAYTAGNYVVTVSMVNGTATCYGSANLTVNVLSHTQAFAPNAFSPNGDGNNDVFQIYGEDIKTLDMKVFNRWGELVYSTTNSMAGWDGSYKGQMQMPGVYTYITVITYLDNSQETKKGTITLLR
jgi:gliding motility-associated-like protein